jgi:hypothetical protein
MAFVQRALGFTFQTGTGSFGASGFNTIQVPDGLWATAKINKQGSPAYNEADIRIFGLSQSIMNQMSRIGLQPAAYRNNIVTVTAGELGGSMPTVFVGGIEDAWPDFSNPTEVAFCIKANTGRLAAMKPATPTSYSGSTSVVSIMQNLAGQMGYTLENNGVTGQLPSPYFSGALRAQALSAAEQAGIYVYFEDDNGVMAIVPKSASRNTTAPTISPAEGMDGYPAYVGPGSIALKTEYNDQIRVLGNVNVQNSIVGNANGSWRVMQLLHDLSTMPDGPWFTEIPLATNVLQN